MEKHVYSTLARRIRKGNPPQQPTQDMYEGICDSVRPLAIEQLVGATDCVDIMHMYVLNLIFDIFLFDCKG